MHKLRRTVFTVIGVCLMPEPVQAQGFLQSLFGGGAGGHVRNHSAPYDARSHHRGRYTPYGGHQPWWGYGQHDRQSFRPRTRTYTAMCVRLCDGYYYPIASRATRSKFHELARRCEDGCNGNAKLFYMPASAPNVKYMTDLTGRSYENLDKAFLYRKRRVKGCSCKPPPWSYQARAEHVQYAAEAARKKRAEAARTRAERLAASRQYQHQRTIVESLDAQGSDDAAVRDAESDIGPDDETAHGWPTTAQATTPQTYRKERRAKRHVRRKRRWVRMRRPRRATGGARRPVRYGRPRVRIRRHY